MTKAIAPDRLTGVWSATPTPLTSAMKLDVVSVKRMVEHHLRLGVKGLFLAGTCGEGPVMPEKMKEDLVRATADCAKGRLVLAAQVTDNSAARILDNIHAMKRCGADVAVIAPPYFAIESTKDGLLRTYVDAIRASDLPVGIYDRGKHSPVFVPNDVIREIYRQKKVILVKDSSADFDRMRIALKVRKERPGLKLLTGWEFKCVPYLQAGYDGLLLGGGIFNGRLANLIMDAARAGDFARAQKLQDRMNRMMWAVYGGKKITCWMSGLKKLLVEMGVFRTWKSFYNYPLTESCRKAIQKVMVRDADVLMGMVLS